MKLFLLIFFLTLLRGSSADWLVAPLLWWLCLLAGALRALQTLVWGEVACPWRMGIAWVWLA